MAFIDYLHSQLSDLLNRQRPTGQAWTPQDTQSYLQSPKVSMVGQNQTMGDMLGTAPRLGGSQQDPNGLPGMRRFDFSTLPELPFQTQMRNNPLRAPQYFGGNGGNWDGMHQNMGGQQGYGGGWGGQQGGGPGYSGWGGGQQFGQQGQRQWGNGGGGLLGGMMNSMGTDGSSLFDLLTRGIGGNGGNQGGR